MAVLYATGSTPMLFEQVLGNVINVMDHGAVGGGVTPDQVAISNCVATASAAGGGIVVCPPATYALTSHIIMLDNVQLWAYGLHAGERERGGRLSVVGLA